jgi:hypothetical protein
MNICRKHTYKKDYNPYAAKVLVFLKKSRIPNEISAIPDRYTNSK